MKSLFTALLIKVGDKQPRVITLPGLLTTFDPIYPLIDTDAVEVVYLKDQMAMLLDENGKIKGKPANSLATSIAAWTIRQDDWISGDVVVVHRGVLV